MIEAQDLSASGASAYQIDLCSVKSGKIWTRPSRFTSPTTTLPDSLLDPHDASDEGRDHGSRLEFGGTVNVLIYETL